MWWHAKRNDLVFFAIFAEFHGVVAIVAVHYKEPVCASRPTLCTAIEVLQPFKPVFKRRPTLLAD